MSESKALKKLRDLNLEKYLISLGIIAVLVFFAMNTNAPGDTMSEVVVLETNMGTIEIELDRENAPITVENFVEYVNDGFYDGLIFHRVIPNFMVQGGGFDQSKAQKDTKPPITLESHNGLQNMRGTVAMARSNDPDSATAQFFINVVDNDFLNHRPGNDGYAVFGKVVSGMDVADSIVNVPTTNNGPHQNWPVEDVVITSAKMK